MAWPADAAPVPAAPLRDRVPVAARRPAGIAGLAVVAATAVAAVLAPHLAPHDPFALAGPPLEGPSAAHPMGTDSIGRDVLSGVLHGTRSALAIVLGAGGLLLVAGLGVGAGSGWRGGWVDDVLMRVTEFVQTVPRFFLALVVIALFGTGLDRIVVVLGLTSWPILARVVRAEVLTLREREFVEAARAAGASGARIVAREVLPNLLPSALAYAGLLVAQALLIEAGLGFLGLSDPNVMSWGALAGQARQYLRVAWWLALFPGLAITALVLALNLLGDAAVEEEVARA